MQGLLKNVEQLIRMNDVKEITLKKVEDSKVEIWEGSVYGGRQLVDYTIGPNAMLAQLRVALLNLQSKTIGYFQPRGTDFLELVIEEDGEMLRTINVTSIGGFQDTHVPKHMGTFRKFGKGRTLLDMANQCDMELTEFTKNFRNHPDCEICKTPIGDSNWYKTPGKEEWFHDKCYETNV
jgi:hypothetical protein